MKSRINNVNKETDGSAKGKNCNSKLALRRSSGQTVFSAAQERESAEKGLHMKSRINNVNKETDGSAKGKNWNSNLALPRSSGRIGQATVSSVA